MNETTEGQRGGGLPEVPRGLDFRERLEKELRLGD